MLKMLPAGMSVAVHIRSIDAARGIAASYVMIAHLFQIMGFKYSLQNQYPLLVNLLSGYPHQAVLFFFLLSGFSIHYVSLDRPLLEWAGIRRYYYLRLRRVVPIFLLAVALVLVLLFIGSLMQLPRHTVAWSGLTLIDLAYTLLFLTDRKEVCGNLAASLATNPPFWSLSYEMFYYLLYPLFWRLSRQTSAAMAFGLVSLLSLAAWLVSHYFGCSHPANLLTLYWVWCAGAWIADLKRSQAVLPLSRSLAYLIPCLALNAVLVVAESSLAWLTTLLWVIVLFVPLAFQVSSGNARRLPVAQKVWLVLVGLAVFVAVAIIAAKHPLAHDMATFTRRLWFLAALWLLLIVTDGSGWRKRLWQRLIAVVAPVGGVSYALYLIHYPILVFFAAALPANPSLAALFAVPPILLAAWWLECRCQPWMARKLDQSRLVAKSVLHGT